MENKQIEEMKNFLHDEGCYNALEVIEEIRNNFLAICLDESKKKYTEAGNDNTRTSNRNEKGDRVDCGAVRTQFNCL